MFYTQGHTSKTIPWVQGSLEFVLFKKKTSCFIQQASSALHIPDMLTLVFNDMLAMDYGTWSPALIEDGCKELSYKGFKVFGSLIHKFGLFSRAVTSTTETASL